MSIARLKKVAIIGPRQENESVLDKLHVWGKLHLCSSEQEAITDASSRDKIEETLGDVRLLAERLKSALRYLQGAQQRRVQLRSEYTRIGSQELQSLVDRILTNQQQRQTLLDRIDGLKEREIAVKPWGNFEFPEGDHIGEQRLWFYLLPRKHSGQLKQLKLPWQIVHQNHNQLWVVVVAPSEPSASLLPCDRVHVGRFSLSELKTQREKAEVELEDIEAERQKLTRYCAQLLVCQEQAEDITDFAKAQQVVENQGELYLIHAWVAETDLPELNNLCKDLQQAVFARPVQDTDLPPTLLKNKEALGGGELLVNFYQTPDYRSWDPSLPLFISFSLFFAMILSDAGYALVMLLGLGALWKKLSGSKTGRLLQPLMLSIVSVSCVWGILVGSYFGREAAPGSLLSSMKILDLNDFDMMMKLSIVCGVIHILIANVQQIVVNWGTHRIWLHFGWLALLISGTTYYLNSQVAVIWQNLSLWVACAGALSIIYGGSERAITSFTSLALRFLEGIKELTNITGLFGDVLSYLRLFALGLASASLALTFNDLADQAFAAEGGFGLVSGLLILLVGHSLNLVLGIVSGVVHGLRLNFIEFYKWALYGEGYPFRAFKKRELIE